MDPSLWDAVTVRTDYTQSVVAAHDRLADAARDGAWTTVFALIAAAAEVDANSIRVGGSTGFAPLHQAAWHGADVDVVTRLVELGAWRSLRSTAGERPIDIASRRGHGHSLDALRPIVRHPLDEATIQALERNLHELIQERVSEMLLHVRLRLPQISPLTELDEPTMWCPIPGMYGGFRIELDEGELTVESWCRVAGGSARTHRVSIDAVRLVDSGWDL